jgi:hypothetical protein
LKGLITQESILINQKFLPEYAIPDSINYIFTSQHPDAVFVEDLDRRYFIHEIVGTPESRPFYERCDRWLKGDGPAALFHYFLNLDLKGFNPREHAPMTMAKKIMAVSGKSDAALWCLQLKEDPTNALSPLGEKVAAECHLFSSTLLMRAFNPLNDKRYYTLNSLSREVTRAGFRQVNRGLPIRTKSGLVRLFAVRDVNRWDNASPLEVAAHFNAYFGPDALKF